jgi:hypothetical protein
MNHKYFSIFRFIIVISCIVCLQQSHAMGRKDTVIIIRDRDTIKVKAQNYSWIWSQKTDRFIIYDTTNRRVVAGPLQPVVVVNTGRNTPATCSRGSLSGMKISGHRLIVTYSNLNGTASLKTSWRFDANGLWCEPIEYTGNKNEDVVSLHYFSTIKNKKPEPGLESYWLIQPGLSASAAISPAQVLSSRIKMDTWLGRGSTIDNSKLLQQWGLPAHFFCGISLPDRPSQVAALTKGRSDAFCCGLADLPAGDLRMITDEGRCAPVLDIRSDLWGQAHGVGPWKLGATFYWSIAPDYRQAIRGYYKGLLREGLIMIKQNSAAKNKVMAMPEFNTWGAQLAKNKYSSLLDQKALDEIYNEFRKSGMKATAFVIDDKWEENYGELQHSTKRLPRFDEFIRRLRNDGFKIGMWAAFLRCENPALLGLDSSNMLKDTNGKAITKGAKPFFLLDVSQPKVQDTLRSRIRQFMKRYHPDIVKFDFGYELPALSMSMPANHGWAGERMLKKFLEIIVAVLREENPDVAVMYYALSPLFLNEFDLHSTDDLFMNEEEFSLEANRRLFFSSLLGELGMPSYGSGGYNWNNMDDIWFDTTPSGSLGSLGSFAGDPSDTKASDRDLAKFNGLAAIGRKSNIFYVEPLHTNWFGANAAHASSWIRYENDVPVLIALRTKNFIGNNKIKATYKDQISANIMVIIASLDERSIFEAKRLGMVVFDKGTIEIKHQGKSSLAKLRAHYSDGTTSSFVSHTVKNGLLQILLTEQSASGKWIEWYEIEFEK